MESYEEVQKFERPATGSGSRPASSGGLSPEHNLLKILFTDLKETTKVQNELSEKNLSLMHLYWDNTGEVSNFADFEARYCLDKGLMSTQEAGEVYRKLEASWPDCAKQPIKCQRHNRLLLSLQKNADKIQAKQTFQMSIISLKGRFLIS